MTHKKDSDYVLGTHDEEVARLGLQHRVWRAAVLDCWWRAGITAEADPSTLLTTPLFLEIIARRE